ncbi:MAG: hypothetical protein IPJ94_24820 [Chloroflexi bacterium]|nr:hypothetical protein [Chloroflexota bacterium]
MYLLLSGLTVWVSGRFNGPDQVGIQVMTAVQNGEVKGLSVTGDRIEAKGKMGPLSPQQPATAWRKLSSITASHLSI